MKNSFEITKFILQTEAKSVNLTQTEKHVLGVLATFLNDKETKGLFTCHPSHNTLKKCTGLGLTSIKNAITKLELLNYITSRQRMDNSKVYTWLSFEHVKSVEALRHILAEEKRLETDKKFKKERGVIFGKNSAFIKKVKQTLEGSPNCTVAKDQLKYAIEARKKGVLYENYQPYKNIYVKRVQIPEPLERVYEYFPEPCIEEQPEFDQPPLEYYNDNHQNNPLMWASSVEDFDT